MRKSLTLGLIGLATLAAVPALAIVHEAKAGPHGGRSMAPQTRAEAQAEVKARFERFDTNKDGTVTRAEFEAASGAMKAQRDARRESRQEDTFASLDNDGNGQISRAEWDAGHPGDGKSGPGGRMPGLRAAMGDRWFDALDANKDGKVTLAEANAAAMARFDRLDANKDGTVTPEERKAAHDARRAKWQGKRA